MIQPCRCRGTQHSVHEACLLRWRRLQALQGKSVGASKCEVCQTRYVAGLRQPVCSSVLEVARVISETLTGLLMYICCGACSPPPWTILGLLWYCFGVMTLLLAVVMVVLPLIIVLYCMSLKLSVLGTGQDMRLGLTSFGPPVDGLSSGVLLVSINAGDPFRRTVLYVVEHNDGGSVALILNSPSEANHEKVDVPLRNEQPSEPSVRHGLPQGSCAALQVSQRFGGPIQRGIHLLHTVEGMPNAQRLLQGQPIFLNACQDVEQGLSALEAASRKYATSQALSAPRAVVVIRGVSSWGEHQLEGEVRRAAWGWIKPEHVKAEDLLDMDIARLGELWDRLIHSPHLEVFQT